MAGVNPYSLVLLNAKWMLATYAKQKGEQEMFDFIMLILWVVVGMLNLCSSGQISKVSYFCIWITVLSLHISNIIA